MREWCKRLKIQNSSEVLTTWNKILESKDTLMQIEALEQLFFACGDYQSVQNGIGLFSEGFYPYDTVYAPLKAISKELMIDIPLFMETVFIKFAQHTLTLYEQNHIPEVFFDSTMSDFALWIDDCYAKDGKYGLCEYMWLANHLRLNLFRLGRMQYQYTVYDDKEVTLGGKTIQRGDFLLKLHVPKGAPIPTDIRMDSYQKAFDFFGIRPLFILCDSWLLFPKHQQILKDTSNIRSFLNDFYTIRKEENMDYRNLMRVFNDNQRRNTSLQIAYQNRIQNKETVGSAVGIFLFDGEKCINGKD